MSRYADLHNVPGFLWLSVWGPLNLWPRPALHCPPLCSRTAAPHISVLLDVVPKCSAAALPASEEQGRTQVAADGPADVNSASATSAASSNSRSSTPSISDKPHNPLPLAVARKVVLAKTLAEAAEVLQEACIDSVSETECLELLVSCLEKGNTALALAIYKEMCYARRQQASKSVNESGLWPAVSLKSTVALVLNLCKQLNITEALQLIADIKLQGLPCNDAVGFGKVVTCPLDPKIPLAVVQPQEGCKLVSDSFTRYEYELYSGTVATCSSEALVVDNNLVSSALRAAGLMKSPPTAAIHTFVLQAPDGSSRTFRCATATADVPGQPGQRLTVVCSPTKNSSRKSGLLNPSPPNTKPGEPLSATNHITGAVIPLLRPPVSGSQPGLPSWAVPAALLLASGDAASSLLDPTFPYLIAAGAAAVVGSSFATSNILIPKLKQLPAALLRGEEVRQQLLKEHSTLSSKVESVLAEAAEDVRTLARLWQLQNKMEAVSGSGTYAARIERVSLARSTIEDRLASKVELLNGYSRVMSMIEIEVEMDIEVPAAEVRGIQLQLERIAELESLQENYKYQAIAKDEVEKLLRAA